MARKVAAVVLLGLMAFAAVASAQTNAELMRNRKYGGHDDEKDTEGENDSYMRSKHDYKPNTDKPEHEEPEIEFKHKKLVKAPHMLTDLEFSLDVADIYINDETIQDNNGNVVQTGVDVTISAALKTEGRDGKEVAHAFLTGVVYPHVDEGFLMNAMMTIAPLGKHNKGTSLIALGRIQLFQDGNRKFSLMPKTDGAKKGSDDAEGPVFTMAIVGGQGEAAGAQGTITLRVSEEGDLKMGFDMTVPKTKEHKQE